MKRRIIWWLAAAITSVTALTGLAYAAGGPADAAASPPAVTHVTGLRPADMPASLPHTHLPTHLLTNSANGSATSGNWSGYAAVACPACHLRYAGTQFTIPSLSCAKSTIGTSGYAFAGHWVGLDGFTNGTVEQTGVDAYCTSTTSKAAYFAWYEMYPLYPVAFAGVSPGDAINASVYFNGTGYQLNLTDITTGGWFATTQPCPSGQTCQHANAEVITEESGGRGRRRVRPGRLRAGELPEQPGDQPGRHPRELRARQRVLDPLHDHDGDRGQHHGQPGRGGRRHRLARNLERIVLTVITRTGYPSRGRGCRPAGLRLRAGAGAGAGALPRGTGAAGAGTADDLVQSH